MESGRKAATHLAKTGGSRDRWSVLIGALDRLACRHHPCNGIGWRRSAWTGLLGCAGYRILRLSVFYLPAAVALAAEEEGGSDTVADDGGEESDEE